MVTKRWQDWVVLLGGIWLFVAPWALDTVSDAASSWNAWTLGVLVTATAWWALARPTDSAPEWINGLFGLWVLVAPWALGFSGLLAASWNAWIVGVVVAGLGFWALADLASTPARPVGMSEEHAAHHTS